MNLLESLKRLRDDIKSWVTNNLNALNDKIDKNTVHVDSKLSSTSTNPVQNKVVTNAINNIPKFSGDYNDLTNAPNITEDDSGNMVIADESGNIIFKADADGIHTTAISLNGEAAATETYVDNAIANIDIPEVDFTGYATEELVAQSIENAKTEISESIVSESDEWKIVDDDGNIIFSVDADGAHTTSLSLNGETAATEAYVGAAIAEIPTPDVSGQIETHNTSDTAHEDIRQAINTAKEELSESIVAESNEWKVVDEAGNIIFSVDASGAHTTELTLNGESAATESYVDNAIANIEFPETDLTDYATKKYVDDAVDSVDFTGYATETYVDNKVADLVNSAPEALNTLGELATALETHEDAYDALLETVGSKATHTDLENLREELSESIVSETDEWKVVDESGNIIFSVDAEGAHTTNLILDGKKTATEDYVDTAIQNAQLADKDIDLTNYYTKQETEALIPDTSSFLTEIPEEYVTETELTDKGFLTEHQSLDGLATTQELEGHVQNLDLHVTSAEKQKWNAKSNFSGDYNDLTNAPAIAEDETGDLVIADNAGNIIFRASDQGLETTHLSIGSLTINGMTIQEIVNACVEEALKNQNN